MNEYIEESCCMLPPFVSIYTALSIFSTCADSLEIKTWKNYGFTFTKNVWCKHLMEVEIYKWLNEM